MICYQDERIPEPFDCTQEELEELIKELEIKNYGHTIDYDCLPDPSDENMPIFDIWHNNATK